MCGATSDDQDRSNEPSRDEDHHEPQRPVLRTGRARVPPPARHPRRRSQHPPRQALATQPGGGRARPDRRLTETAGPCDDGRMASGPTSPQPRGTLPPGSVHAVLVAGDAGMGKTRLLAELTAQASSAGWRVMVGHCLDLADLMIPNLPFSELMGRFADEDPDTAREVV